MSERHPVALVLSGGGARGAYEVGVVAGIVEVLKKTEGARGAFDIFTGTSVGAINASYLAAHADSHDLGIRGLIAQWTQLELSKHLKLDPVGLVGVPKGLRWLMQRTKSDEALSPHLGRAVLDPRALEAIVEKGIPWDRLRRNIENRVVHSLVVSALDVAGGRTTIFADHAKGLGLAASRDLRRITRNDQITAEHVLASAAIPLLFPARRIGQSYFCDGGLRFNTPISPALRSGAEKIVVVSLLHGRPPALQRPLAEDLAQYPNPLFLAGKVLNALLLDPVDYDLQVLERLNKLLEVLEQTLSTEHYTKFMQVLEEQRGARYRRVDSLVFRPSEDIGMLAGKYISGGNLEWHGSARLAGFALKRAVKLGDSVETDFGSFLLFDGAFARQLIDLGRKDALARADEILAFFANERRTIPPPPPSRL